MARKVEAVVTERDGGQWFAVAFFIDGVEVGGGQALTRDEADGMCDQWVSSQRPVRGRPRKHSSDAARRAAYRERTGSVQCNVLLPADVAAALDEFVSRQVDGAGLGKSEVIVRLLRTQLLRKR
jgi:hypothetical protein